MRLIQNTDFQSFNVPLVIRKLAWQDFGLLFYNIRKERYILNVKQAAAAAFVRICNERKIAVNELAMMSGVTPSTAYSMLDDRRKNVSLSTVKKFCDGLNIKLGDFFSSKEFENLDQEIE